MSEPPLKLEVVFDRTELWKVGMDNLAVDGFLERPDPAFHGQSRHIRCVGRIEQPPGRAGRKPQEELRALMLCSTDKLFFKVERKSRRHCRDIRRVVRPPDFEDIFLLLRRAGRPLHSAGGRRRSGSVGGGRAQLNTGVPVGFVVVAEIVESSFRVMAPDVEERAMS